MARITTPQGASAKARRRRTCRCRSTHISPIPRSVSANRGHAMGGHSNYQPKSAAEKWLHERLPIVELVKAQVFDFPTPKNLNYWWTFGGILAFMLVVQLITGIVLAMHYTPHADFAFDSVEHIMRDVN